MAPHTPETRSYLLYAPLYDSKSKQKYVKFLFVKLTKYFYKKIWQALYAPAIGWYVEY
jgi:hypothetical protein